MKLELALRTIPAALCAVLCTMDARGQAPTDAPTKTMRTPPTATKPANRGVRIGVTINPLNEALAAQLGLEASKGILVEDVVENGPAATAGLQRFDVIVAMNDEEVSSEKGLRNHLAGLDPGDTVTIKVVRKGETLLIPVVVDERPADAGEVGSLGGLTALPAAPTLDEPSQLRAWADQQRAWAEQVTKQQAEWAKQLGQQSRAWAEEFKAQHQAEIDQWTDKLVAQADQWRDQAAELNTPENRAKFESETRELVQQLMEKARQSGQWLRVPAIRYSKAKDGSDQAIIDAPSAGSESSSSAPFSPSDPQARSSDARLSDARLSDARLQGRLDLIEQRMEKIEQMLERLTAAQAAGSGGR